MRFNKLEDRMGYLRGLSDHRLIPGQPVLMMLDGRSFSKLIKKKFKRPFDNDFVYLMNETAKYLMQNVTGCKLAFVQSDEISLYINDYENQVSDSFFGYRMCKLLSITAAMAASKFNQLMTDFYIRDCETVEEARKLIAEKKLAEFDSKAWNVPTENDVYAWFLYRQIDCIRNSKQQTAQTWIPHKRLMNLDTDKQIALLKSEHGIDWGEFDDGLKYGRFIIKTSKHCHNEELNLDYDRSELEAIPAWPLTDSEGRKKLHELGILKNWAPTDVIENGPQSAQE